MNRALQYVIIFHMIIVQTSQCVYKDKKSAICTDQNFQEIPNHFPPSIRNLMLSHNNITAINRENIKRYPQIRQLDLDYNKIRSSNSIRSVSALRKLQILSISANDLIVLDFQIFHMNLCLEELIANNNPGIYIKESPVNLNRLERISLKYNNLSSFPLNAFKGFPNLKILDLRNNELNFLPENTNEVLPNLIQLYISGNHITRLDHFLFSKSDLSSVTELSISTARVEIKQHQTNFTTLSTTLTSEIPILNQFESDKSHSINNSTFRTNKTTTISILESKITKREITVSPTNMKKSTKLNTEAELKKNIQASFMTILLYTIYTFAAVNVVLLIVAICLVYLNYVRRRKVNEYSYAYEYD